MFKIENGVAHVATFLLVDETDDETAETGLSPTVYISKAGGAFATTTNSATEISVGWYKVTLTTTETNTDGELILYATGTGADIWRTKYLVYTPDTSAVSVTITATQMRSIADHVIRRDLSNVEDSADGDTADKYSLLGMALKTVGRVVVDGVDGEFDVYETDGTTLFYNQGLSQDASAVPIVGTSG